jgi:hypothetical protein
MSVQTVVNQPAPFIEAAGKTFLQDLTKAVGDFKGADLSQVMGRQFIAGEDPLTAQARSTALGGIGGYQPFLTSAAASAGPTGYQQFMSPFQKDVIDTTLADFDKQTQAALPGMAASAINAGAFGGGREGVQRAEFLSNQGKNRAALQAQLLQQGFNQAQNLAQANLANQLSLAGAQQNLLGQDVGVLGALGGQRRADAQALLSADQQLAQSQLQQPLEAAQTLGSGVTSLIAGYPGGTRQTVNPTPSGLQTGLSGLSTLAGIYRMFNPPVQRVSMV